MKRFYIFMSMALIAVIVAALSVMNFSASAATLEVYSDVVFVSDNATEGGDGKTANTPLYPSNLKETVAGNNTYQLSNLYQAAEKLLDKGGTIVVCGPVVIDGDDCQISSSTTFRDFYFPGGTKPIVITSVYDGVDYSKPENGGAYLAIKQPAEIRLGTDTEFNNISINVEGNMRCIFANGNKLVMGDNVTTSVNNTDAYKSNLSICGGIRFGDFTGNTDITIMSGTYSNICGAGYSSVEGPSHYVGDTKITIKGGTIKGNICGGNPFDFIADNNKVPWTQEGDVQIDVYGGVIERPILLTGQGGFSTNDNNVKINIYGGTGTFTTASAKIENAPNSASVSNYLPSNVYLNLSNTGLTDSLINNFINNATAAMFDITYPASWITSGSWTVKPKTPSVVLNNETLTAEGAVLSVTYKNGKTKTITYNPEDKAFETTCNTGVIGTQTVTYKYGTLSCSDTVKVVKTPSLVVEGAKIRVDRTDYTQGLRFVVNQTGDLQSGMVIAERGVIAVPFDIINDETKLNFETMAGMNVLTPNVSRGDYDEETGYTCTIYDIPLNRFNIDYIVKAYMKLSYEGETYYVYSDAVRRNPYKIAQQAAAQNSVETAEIKDYLQTNVINAYESYKVPERVTSGTLTTVGYADSTALRQKVVDYMEAQMNIKWTPKETFRIYNTGSEGVGINMIFEKGKTYYGLPYTNFKSSQNESFIKFMNGVDSNGNMILDFDLMKQSGYDVNPCSTTDTVTSKTNYNNFPGSDCSTAVITSWNSVINNRLSMQEVNGTANLIPGKVPNIIPVGNYKYLDDSGRAYDNTNRIISANSADEIYASYDLLQPGDAVIEYRGSGHVRMVVEVDKVNKTVTTIECASWGIPNATVSSISGSQYYTDNNTCWRRLTYSYSSLRSSNYIPITIPELVTGHSDKEMTVVTDLSLDKDLPEMKLNGTVISNKQIVYLEAEVTDGSNTQKVYYKLNKSTKFGTVYAFYTDLDKMDFSEVQLNSGTEYGFTLKVCVPGKEPYNLIDNYRFTAK